MPIAIGHCVVIVDDSVVIVEFINEVLGCARMSTEYRDASRAQTTVLAA